MQIDYYEACVLSRINKNPKSICLDDFHKLAWSLFSAGKHYEKGNERPFVFRVETALKDRLLITLRSDRAFEGAVAKRVEVAQGDEVALDFSFIPVRRPDHGPQRTPPSGQWPNYGQGVLDRAGLSVTSVGWSGDVNVELAGYFKIKPDRPAVMPLVDMHCWATVNDVEAFSRSMIDGIGRKRGYGAGMIRIAPESPVREANRGE